MSAHHSEISSDQRRERDDWILTNWRKSYDVANALATEAVKYLFTINLTSAGALLAFMGTGDRFKSLGWARTSFGLFVAGVLGVGLYLAFRYHTHMADTQKRTAAVKEYFADRLDWRELVLAYEQNPRHERMSIVFAYLIFGCWMAGALVSFFGFRYIS